MEIEEVDECPLWVVSVLYTKGVKLSTIIHDADNIRTSMCSGSYAGVSVGDCNRLICVGEEELLAM